MKVILDIPDGSKALSMTLLFDNNEGGQTFSVNTVAPSNGMIIKRDSYKESDWEEEA